MLGPCRCTLHPRRLELKHAIHAHTHIGMVRDENQDSVGFHQYAEDLSLLIVADGMGGYAGGSVASSLVTSTMLSHLEPVAPEDLRANPALHMRLAIHAANLAVNQEAHANPELRDMGSTVVAVIADSEKAYVAHVGDSRAYLLRQGEIRQITEDHTVVQDLVRAGYILPEDADNHPSSGILTRCLGQVDMADPTLSEPIQLASGDCIILCSDGLSGMIDDEEIASIVCQETPEEAAERLIEAANTAGGFDNITVGLLYAGDFPASRNWPIQVGEPLYPRLQLAAAIDEPTIPFRYATRDKAKLHDTMSLQTSIPNENRKMPRPEWLWPLLIGLGIVSVGLFLWYFLGTAI